MVVMEEGFMSNFAGVILPSSQQGRIFSNQIKIDDKIIIHKALLSRRVQCSSREARASDNGVKILKMTSKREKLDFKK